MSQTRQKPMEKTIEMLEAFTKDELKEYKKERDKDKENEGYPEKVKLFLYQLHEDILLISPTKKDALKFAENLLNAIFVVKCEPDHTLYEKLDSIWDILPAAVLNAGDGIEIFELLEALNTLTKEATTLVERLHKQHMANIVSALRTSNKEKGNREKEKAYEEKAIKACIELGMFIKICEEHKMDIPETKEKPHLPLTSLDKFLTVAKVFEKQGDKDTEKMHALSEGIQHVFKVYKSSPLEVGNINELSEQKKQISNVLDKMTKEDEIRMEAVAEMKVAEQEKEQIARLTLNKIIDGCKRYRGHLEFQLKKLKKLKELKELKDNPKNVRDFINKKLALINEMEVIAIESKEEKRLPFSNQEKLQACEKLLNEDRFKYLAGRRGSFDRIKNFFSKVFNQFKIDIGKVEGREVYTTLRKDIDEGLMKLSKR